MEAKWSSETPFHFKLTRRRYIPEDRTVRNCRCENLRSYTTQMVCYRVNITAAHLSLSWARRIQFIDLSGVL
jgi:hypothetical protein